jgi:hypothetical protein
MKKGKFGRIFIALLLISIFIVIKFGYFNITYYSPSTIQEHNAYIGQYDFIRSDDFKLYPTSDLSKRIVNCQNNIKNKCTVFFAINEDIKVNKDQEDDYSMPSINPKQVLIEGFSVKFTEALTHYKYFTIDSQKSLTLFKSKF